MFLRSAGFALLACLATGGCARPAPTAPDAALQPSAPDRVEVPRVIVTPDATTSVDELFSTAMRSLDGRDYAAAGEGLRRVYELDPDGPLAAEALFWRGTAQDLGAEPAEALRTYELLSSRFPNSARTRTALVRRARLYAWLDRLNWIDQSRRRSVSRNEHLRFTLRVSFGSKCIEGRKSLCQG